ALRRPGARQLATVGPALAGQAGRRAHAAADAFDALPGKADDRARGRGMEEMAGIVTGGTMDIGPVTLEGSHVRLEPLKLSHVDALCEVGLDDELWRWTTSQVRTRADMRRYVQMALNGQKTATVLPFVTMLASENRVIGSTRFANIDR